MFKNFATIEELPSTCVVFKHSSTCPISAAAHQEVEAYLTKHNITIYKLVVQEQPALKLDIAQHFLIKHESPQVIIIHDGKVKKVLNHRNITRVAIEDVIN